MHTSKWYINPIQIFARKQNCAHSNIHADIYVHKQSYTHKHTNTRARASANTHAHLLTYTYVY